MGEYLAERYESTTDTSYLQKSIQIARNAMEATPLHDGHWHRRLYTLGYRAIDKFLHTHTLADLEQAICALQTIIDADTSDDLNYTLTIQSIGWLMNVKFHETRDVADLDRAISMMQDVIDRTPPNHPNRSDFLSILQTSLYYRYNYTGETADIEEGICLGQDLTSAAPLNHPERASHLISLATCFYSRYSGTKDIEDLNKAITLSQEAYITVPLTHQVTVGLQHGLILFTKYEHSGEMAFLEDSIHVFFRAAEACPIDDRKWPIVLGTLGDLLKARYSCTNALADVDAAVIMCQTAIATLPNHDSERDHILVKLGMSLSDRYRHTRAATDLEEAICAFQEAPNATSLDSKTWFPMLSKFVFCLNERFSCTKELSDIEKSIDLLRESIGSIQMNDSQRARILGFLGCCLNIKYTHTSALIDLDESICVSRDSLETFPPDDELRIEQLHILGTYLAERYSRTGATPDLNEAIFIFREYLEAMPPNYHGRFKSLQQLSNILSQRFEHSGEIADLQEAILISREVLNSMPISLDVLIKAKVLHGVVGQCFKRYLSTGTKADLDELIRITQDAADTAPETHPFQCQMWCQLGAYLNDRYTQTATLTDVEDGRKYLVSALYHESGNPIVRFFAGHMAMMSSDFINYPQAYDVVKYTIDLIPLLARRDFPNALKQFILSCVAGTSSDAAAITLQKLPDDDRCLLEQRDLSTLKNRYPDLADSFLILEDQLYQPYDPNTLNGTNMNIKTEKNRIEKDFVTLLETIRSKNDFERFLLPASKADMVQAACEDKIVIVNLSVFRCDALIIEKSGLRVLELPYISQGALSELLLIERFNDIESPGTLAWLWDDIVCPVLDALGFTETPSKESKWPHVWWIPMGLLTEKLPLHAAGHHLRRSGETTLDRVVSSYATSVNSIIHGRQRQAPTLSEPINLVTVAMEETDGQTNLIHAQREIDAISNILEPESINNYRPAPYRNDVLLAIETCQIFHFAGHGESHPTNPLQSTLLLRDWQDNPLTVASLLETNVNSSQPFLAYLSACGSGQTTYRESLDESIHLANAFQLAGFRHVIGTLWSVDDELCVEIAQMTYKSLRRGLRDELVSWGLHDAVRTLRDRWVDRADGGAGNASQTRNLSREGRHAQLDDDIEPGQPLWIPYVHFGV
ncbi:hypothetical protein TRIATDRAFT_239890, partial [Trichoderma atroviride IMI 206040]